MSTSALSLDSEDSPTWWDRVVSEFPAAAEEWSRCIDNVNRWEEDHLLSGREPSPEDLAKHRKIVERLMYFGQLCSLVASHPEFGDEETAQMVSATQRVEALYQAQEGEPKHRQRWLATYDRLINDAASRLAPGQTRVQLHDAILF